MTQNEITEGTEVQVPNGEYAIVIDTFRKDGDDRLEVQFADGATLTISMTDVKKVVAW